MVLEAMTMLALPGNLTAWLLMWCLILARLCGSSRALRLWSSCKRKLLQVKVNPCPAVHTYKGCLLCQRPGCQVCPFADQQPCRLHMTTATGMVQGCMQDMYTQQQKQRQQQQQAFAVNAAR